MVCQWNKIVIEWKKIAYKWHKKRCRGVFSIKVGAAEKNRQSAPMNGA